jgi:ABC-type dipeptide/oligopeptide/nickel transport system permease subunit
LFLGLFLGLVLGWPVLLQPAVARHLPVAMTWSAVEISDAQFQAPSLVHWCGTDVHGRDMTARMIHGARISLLVGLFGAGVSLVIGALWGAVAGYVGGRWDSAMMRFVDILYSLPSIVFVIVLIATLDGFLKSWSSPLLTQADLRDVPGLLVRLRTDENPAVRALVGGFSSGFREALARTPTPPLGQGMGRQLAAELNLRMNAGSWLADRSFVELQLRPRTLALRKVSAGVAESALLNRSVLEDLFPREIRRHDRWYASLLKTIFSPKLGASTQMIYLFIGLGAVSWLTMARIVRGQVLSLRSRAFVDASRALGAGHARILLRHILPNVAGVIVVYLTLTIPSIILYESFLSYLGLGIQPPQASLGSLIAEGAAQINSVRVYWWMILAPAGLLAAVLLALNFIGDGLRDAFDPRAAER